MSVDLEEKYSACIPCEKSQGNHPQLRYLNHVDQSLLIDLIEVSGLGLDDAHVIHQNADLDVRDGVSDVVVDIECPV